MNTATAAVANHLQIAADLIQEIQEWASVLWVRVMGRRPTFVSKKITAEEKMTEALATATKTIEQALEQIGNRWQKGSMDRIYFSDLHKFAGLELSFYKTGNISSATLNGHSISNSEGRRMYMKFISSYCKLWWDVPTQKFCWKGGPDDNDLREQVIRGIANEVNHQGLWDVLDI